MMINDDTVFVFVFFVARMSRRLGFISIRRNILVVYEVKSLLFLLCW